MVAEFSNHTRPRCEPSGLLVLVDPQALPPVECAVGQAKGDI